ncbi:hypothetical protein D210916BOD24_18400 [Alteromonas sp. D210916BOD_24]|uniref:PAS domain-containing hybrid sensor histidine kinase/response regulator n=1 Tax=Alteromonas sp. D210916BOD_24 TaxID=3157618 RepID=UPI00399CC5FC
MVDLDKQASFMFSPELPLKASLNKLVRQGCDSLNVTQGLLVSITDKCMSTLIKVSSIELPNEIHTPTYDNLLLEDASFPLYSDKVIDDLKYWFKKYFGTEKYIRGRYHYFDGQVVCLLFLNACPSVTGNLKNVALLDEWLALILEKYTSEKAEAQQFALYNKLQNVANIGTWEVDLVNNTLSWSSQTKQIHEVPDDFVPTMENAISFYKAGYDRDEITRIVSHAIKTGEPWGATLQLVSAKNNPVWIETHGMAEMENGKCVRLFGTCQNVNRAVQLRLEIEEKQKLAEEASAERGMLLSRISHELKTPLNGITGMLQAIKFEGNDNIRVRKVDLALHSADRLLTLINDVLDYTSIVNGQFALNVSHFCIRSLIEELVEAYKLKCALKGLRLLAVLSFDEHTYVNGDPGRLSQILTNLLSNAVKFTETGYVSFHVTLKQHADVPILLASIEDTGIGMNKEVLSNIFKPFQSNTHSVSEELNGKGLGLSIVGQLVEKMKGEIEVRSTPGEGSVFDVVIPIDMVSDPLGQSNEASVPSELLRLPLNVLVVDDNDINRFVLTSMLEKYNYIADEAENGEVAVAKARTKQYDIIFMDCAMPVLDGTSATKIILEEQLLAPKGFVVAVTANTSPQDMANCSEAGMADFLAKPVVQDEIAVQIQKALQSKSAA